MAEGDGRAEWDVTGPLQVEPTAATSAWPAAWYPDPWFSGQHRYWTGESWTADVRPDAAPPTYPAPAPGDPWAPAGPERRAGPERPAGRGRWLLLAVGMVLVALLSGAVAAAITTSRRTTTSAPSAAALAPTTPTTPGPVPAADPDQASLQQLVARPADVDSTETVDIIPHGTEVAGQPTLDLCNATFPSERLRTARRQVDVTDAQGTVVLSTEAVLYQNTAATVQAFSELAAAAAKCPNSIVTSPVGEPSVKTTFNAAPDAAWPQTPDVVRQAYDFVTTDDQGQTHHAVAVYLRRGRALMGVYFSEPDVAQAAVAGQTTIPGIVGVFAARLAQLPPASVDRNVAPPSTA